MASCYFCCPKKEKVMILEILTDQISESSALIIAACVLLSAAAMALDSLFERRHSEKTPAKADLSCTWHNGSDGIDPEGVPFSGLEPQAALPELSAQTVITPDGVPCLDGDGFIDLSGNADILERGTDFHHAQDERSSRQHGLA